MPHLHRLLVGLLEEQEDIAVGAHRRGRAAPGSDLRRNPSEQSVSSLHLPAQLSLW
jgi:hypothetical protein